MILQPIHNHILFQFVDDAVGDSLVTKTKSGIMMSRDMDFDEQRDPRWGKVLAVGPEVDELIKVNEYILIESLQWTPGIEFNGIKLWKTVEPKVLAVSSEELRRY